MSHGPKNRRFGSDLGQIVTLGRSRLSNPSDLSYYFVIILFALELMNAFPGGSLASDIFGRAISC